MPSDHLAPYIIHEIFSYSDVKTTLDRPSVDICGPNAVACWT